MNCDLCGVSGLDLIDGLCVKCNPDSHLYEAEQLEIELWKE